MIHTKGNTIINEGKNGEGRRLDLGGEHTEGPQVWGQADVQLKVT